VPLITSVKAEDSDGTSMLGRCFDRGLISRCENWKCKTVVRPTSGGVRAETSLHLAKDFVKTLTLKSYVHAKDTGIRLLIGIGRLGRDLLPMLGDPNLTPVW
jgi:hypothetical protein